MEGEEKKKMKNSIFLYLYGHGKDSFEDFLLGLSIFFSTGGGGGGGSVGSGNEKAKITPLLQTEFAA